MSLPEIALQALYDGVPVVVLFLIPVVIDMIHPTTDQEVTAS